MVIEMGFPLKTGFLIETSSPTATDLLNSNGNMPSYMVMETGLPMKTGFPLETSFPNILMETKNGN